MNGQQTKAEEARSLARREFVWSIRTQRLCAAAVRRYAKPDISREEAAKTNKAEAAEYIARAEQWASEQITKSQQRGEITEDEAKKARQELANIAEDAKKQADRLTEAYIAEIRAEATKAAAQTFAKAYKTAEIEAKKEKRK